MEGWVGLVRWRFTHISGHPSAVGRAQDSESSPVKDQRSTTVPRNQPGMQTHTILRLTPPPYSDIEQAAHPAV